MTLIKPSGYRNLLENVENTEKAIKHVKDMFQENLSAQLALLRVTAPMVVLTGTGINDDLNSVERPVSFPIRDMNEQRAEVVHSLAKWKRLKLGEMKVAPGRGIYTDMNALRPDEELDNIHSLYVDQWDWEKVITREQRNIAFLKQTVRRIYEAIKVTENKLYVEFPQLVPSLPEEIHFIHAQQLLDLYPGKKPKERENEIVRRYGAVFVMGIRVDETSLARQLEIRGQQAKRDLYFHKKLLAGELPCTIGGGIGQSRLCMYLLRKAHIGEIQSSIWPESMRRECSEAGIELV